MKTDKIYAYKRIKGNSSNFIIVSNGEQYPFGTIYSFEEFFEGRKPNDEYMALRYVNFTEDEKENLNDYKLIWEVDC